MTVYFRLIWERSGSVVECLSRDQGFVGMNLASVTLLCLLSKTH